MVCNLGKIRDSVWVCSVGKTGMRVFFKGRFGIVFKIGKRMVVCLMRKMRDFICVGKIRDVLGMLCIIGKMKDGVNGREGVGWCVL